MGPNFLPSVTLESFCSRLPTNCNFEEPKWYLSMQRSTLKRMGQAKNKSHCCKTCQEAIKWCSNYTKNRALIKSMKCTMLQKLSKCEVKAWLWWNLIILLPLRFYVKSNFSELELSKNVIFGNFWDTSIWILVNLGLESCSNLLKS